MKGVVEQTALRVLLKPDLPQTETRSAHQA